MRVSIATSDRCVIINAQEERATTVADIDRLIKALRVAREWLRKELEQKK